MLVVKIPRLNGGGQEDDEFYAALARAFGPNLSRQDTPWGGIRAEYQGFILTYNLDSLLMRYQAKTPEVELFMLANMPARAYVEER